MQEEDSYMQDFADYHPASILSIASFLLVHERSNFGQANKTLYATLASTFIFMVFSYQSPQAMDHPAIKENKNMGIGKQVSISSFWRTHNEVKLKLYNPNLILDFSDAIIKYEEDAKLKSLFSRAQIRYRTGFDDLRDRKITNDYELALFRAAMNEYHITPDEFNLLCTYVKKIDSQDSNRNTALHLVVMCDENDDMDETTRILLDFARILLEKKANPNIKNNCDATPLHYAAIKEHPYFIENLLEYAPDIIDIDAKDKNGKTPLHWAVEQGKEKCAETLLDKGADSTLSDNNGITPLALGKEKNMNAFREHSQTATSFRM